MKTLMIGSVAALALIASQAGAQTSYGPNPGGPNPGGYGGGDAVAQWYISGQASAFCVLGTAQNSGGGNGGYNVTIDSNSSAIAGQSGNSSDTRSGSTSDGTISINQFQGTNDHANAWQAVINLNNSICNTAYSVTAKSANGGLKYTGTQTTSDPNFAQSEGYTVAATFGSNGGSAQQASSLNPQGTLITRGSPTYGNFMLTFQGAADNSQYLLAGTYQDNVLITMAPVASGTSPTPQPV